MEISTQMRNGTLEDLAALLTAQQEVKLDAVIPAQAMRSENGQVVVAGLGLDGPVGPPGRFAMTSIFEGDLASALSIPVKYARSLRDRGRLDLLDANFNGLLHGGVVETSDGPLTFDPEGKTFLFRSFLDGGGGTGLARALLSDSYRRVDNLDVLLGALSGVRETGADVRVHSCSLTERRMVVKLACPGIKAVATKLLENYRNPFAGEALARWRRVASDESLGFAGGTEPIIYAGVTIANGETGGSAFTLTPEVMVQVCTNGLRITEDIIRAVHLGGRQDEGIVTYSERSEVLSAELIKSRTADAVTAFLNYDYLASFVEKTEAKAVKVLADPAKIVEVVANKLSFTEQEAATTLSLFINGGQNTAGGVMQAVSALAQTVPDADRAFDIEGLAMQALELAYSA